MGATARRFFIFVFTILLLSANALALHHNISTRRARAARRHTRHVVWRTMFRGSHDMLVRQNEVIDRLELPRVEDDDQLAQLEENGTLVRVRESRALEIASDLTDTRRYCRPWTRDFLEDFSQAFYREFRQPIRITSLVRTVAQQKKLRRRNRNAGPTDGDTASTHLTGITADISRKGLTRQQQRWVEQYFLSLKERGVIEPVEERRQAVFHVVVYGSYSEQRPEQITERSSSQVSN